MKTLIFSAMTLAALLLVGWQHQQIGNLRAENKALQQSSAEAEQLKADLAKSSGDGAQDAVEIERLQKENRDLLKLRNEVYQLRETRGQFEKVSAENQRLQSQAKSVPKSDAKPGSMQPVVLRMDTLFNRGLSTPEDAVQTFYWAQRERDGGTFSHSVTPRSWNNFKDYLDDWRQQNLKNVGVIQIVARRDVDATTVQLGLQLQQAENPQYGEKIIITLVLQGNEWRVDSTSR